MAVVFYREGWLFFCNQRTRFFLHAFHVNWRVGKVPKEERKEKTKIRPNTNRLLFICAPLPALSLSPVGSQLPAGTVGTTSGSDPSECQRGSLVNAL